MAGEGELLVLQREHEDLEEAPELVVVPLVRTVQRLFQGKLQSACIYFISFIIWCPRSTVHLLENFVS